MKKFISLALCAATVVSASAQIQAVKDAKKLSGKIDKIEEARALIQGAMANPETANDVLTYVVAGNIEWDAFDKAQALLMINPQDASAGDVLAQAEQLLNGYKYFMQALPLDSLPNEKGQVKPKYTKEIAGKIANHANAFYTAGANAFNSQKYYPEAYEGFIIYASMPDMPLLAKSPAMIDPATRAAAFFNAGIAAYSGNQVDLAADAFHNARVLGYEGDKGDEAYLYELACWQAIANDKSREDEAQKKIFEIAQAGNDKYGSSKPVYLNNLVNCIVSEEKYADAMNMVNKEIAATPDVASLYSLRAFIENRMGDIEGAEADYRRAAEMDTADFESLKNATAFMFKRGQELWDKIEGNSTEAMAQRKNVRDNYWKWAQNIGNRAYSITAVDTTLDGVMDNIEYMLSLCNF